MNRTCKIRWFIDRYKFENLDRDDDLNNTMEFDTKDQMISDIIKEEKE